MICSKTLGGWEHVPSNSMAMMARVIFNPTPTRLTGVRHWTRKARLEQCTQASTVSDDTLNMTTLDELAQRLAGGAVRARTLVDTTLDRITDPAGEGARAFNMVNADAARARADEVDRARAAGQNVPAFAGIPLALKDLFDVTGEVTSAGSRLLKDEPPAARDAPVVARLRAAGFIFIGRNTMTEFAYSGLGLNPHYGTPASPFDRATRRIPGGSTSGGAVAVADGMAAACLGTDTGGSCRIPAAFCGIVGFKPTAHRVPRAGVVPLSHSFDSVGPLANSVACCATLDAIIRGVTPLPVAASSIRDIRLLLPTTLVLDDMDEHVAASFEHALDTLVRAGAKIERRDLPELLRIKKHTLVAASLRWKPMRGIVRC
jgi:aspartyl-tRNA(Asn)/glutamyl-tRNA(Gln) amidotransferase subunit A